MRPEADISVIVRSVCPQSGHWPYTRDADLYIGYRPGNEELETASNRVTGVQVEYDIVICGKRGTAAQMETMRYQLYDALLAGGWRLAGKPGPEAYIAEHQLFLWPLTAVKRFAVVDKRPEDPKEARKGGRQIDGEN